MPYAAPATSSVGPTLLSPSVSTPHSAFMLPVTPASSHRFDTEPLPSVPRSRPGHKTRFTAPSIPSPQPTSVPIPKRTQSHQPSTAGSTSSKAKRVRGQRTPTFTTAVATSSSSNSDDDSDTPKATPGSEQPPNKLVTPPLDTNGASLTVGRRAGQDYLRKAASIDTTAEGMASSPMINVESASPAMTLVSSGMTGEELQVKRRHQAISAGQGGVLRLNMDAIQRSRSASPSVRSSASPSGSLSGSAISSLLSPGMIGRPKYATIGSNSNLVRKKSGELVKPALRSSRSNSNSNTPFLDEEPDCYTVSPSTTLNHSMMYRRNSAPSTPTPKNVKFDTHLEHVKLFSSEQKPAAVSRDGSPNGYGSTTEEESGYPWSKNLKDRKADGVIKVRIIDGGSTCLDNEQPGPISKCLSIDPNVDVRLESLVWDEDAKSLKGNVVVRNIAFAKRVSARFTLDWWQTTSEVAGRYIRGVFCPREERASALSSPTPPVETHDRFAFVIKLADVLAKIEEKTLFIAIRYSVEGRELWDNNEGRNYHVAFHRVSSPPLAPAKVEDLPTQAPKVNTALVATVPSEPARRNPPGSSLVDPIADLRRELERTVNDDDALGRRPVCKPSHGALSSGRRVGVSIAMPAGSNQSSPSLSPYPSPGVAPVPPTLRDQLSTRYDLSASINDNTWDPRRLFQASSMSNNMGSPSVRGFSRAAIPFPVKVTSSSGEISKERVASPPPRAQPQPPQIQTSVMGSPRDGGTDGYFEETSLLMDTDYAQLVSPSESSNVSNHNGSGDSHKRGRNHKRGSSYFDGWVESISRLRLTPPGTPKDVLEQRMGIEDIACEDEDTEREGSQEHGLGIGAIGGARSSGLMRYNSYPFSTSSASVSSTSILPGNCGEASSLGVRGGDLDASMASTPSATSASSPSQSPSSPPYHLPLLPTSSHDVTKVTNGSGQTDVTRTILDSSNYNFFLDRFCFYTGGDGDPRRIHSDSEVDNYFANAATPFTPPAEFSATTSLPATLASGSSTPTSRESPGKESTGECVTPRPGTPAEFDASKAAQNLAAVSHQLTYSPPPATPTWTAIA